MKQLQTGLFAGLILFTVATARADTTWVAAGNVSGTWSSGGSPYMIYDGWVTVPFGQSLEIGPGTKIFFTGPFVLEVLGRFRAIGTVQDSILFTAADAVTAEQAWRGIFFAESSHDSCRISYAALEHANGPGVINGTGGAIQTYGCPPRFDHCAFRNNHAIANLNRYGGGAYVYGDHPIFSDCVFTGNFAGTVGHGGGLTIDHSQANLIRCSIVGNTAGHGGAVFCRTSSAVFHECDLSQNTTAFNGGAIYADGDSAAYNHCTIRENSCTENGGGICSISGVPSFRDCELTQNQGFWGGAVYSLFEPAPAFERCVMNYNIAAYGGAIYASQASPQIALCTITHNTATLGDGGAIFLGESEAHITSTIITYSIGGEGIYFDFSPNAVVEYCDVAVNSGGAFDGHPDQSAMPVNIGSLTQTNANDDSCDAYHNIFREPEFMNAVGGDYHLNWDSPCIDAGDPEFPLDPDGTVADIGAFYFDQLRADDDYTLPPSSFVLSAYPNPFNALTQITFDLPRNANAELTLYDIAGREVKTLAQGDFSAGTHTVLLDAANLPSGVYLYRLTAANASQTRKLVLIK